MRNVLVLTIYLILLGILLFVPGITSSYGFVNGLVVTLGFITAAWIFSLFLKDAGIMDILWGLGILLLAISYAWEGHQFKETRDFVLLSMVAIWALRLAIHIALKNAGRPEDWRYLAWREEHGKRWWWRSFLQVFLLQGSLLWGMAQLFPVSLYSLGSNLVLTDMIGIALWLIGMYFEVVGDYQLRKFKRNRISKDEILQKGLWKFTRHPNYFGEALIWWGFWMFTWQSGYALIFIIHPLMMTFLLIWVSGVKMTERKMKQKKGYAGYMKRTSMFVPWFPLKRNLSD